MNAYVYALGTSLCFGLASLVFTFFTKRVSSAFVNFIKALIALFCFGLYLTITQTWVIPEATSHYYLLFSGFIGLGIGDVFLLMAFSQVGPGRTLMLFGFQPLILGLMSYLILGQQTDFQQLGAIIFFMACLFTFSLESYHKNRSWGLKGLSFALLGVLFDAAGLIITRAAFDLDPNLGAMQGNFHRCLGALGFFFLYQFFRPLRVFERLKGLTFREKSFLFSGSFVGTFLSLSLFLAALRVANLASLSSISMTSPLFASLFESLYSRSFPSRYVFLAFAFFLCGMSFLLFS